MHLVTLPNTKSAYNEKLDDVQTKLDNFKFKFLKGLRSVRDGWPVF